MFLVKSRCPGASMIEKTDLEVSNFHRAMPMVIPAKDRMNSLHTWSKHARFHTLQTNSRRKIAHHARARLSVCRAPRRTQRTPCPSQQLPSQTSQWFAYQYHDICESGALERELDSNETNKGIFDYAGSLSAGVTAIGNVCASAMTANFVKMWSARRVSAKIRMSVSGASSQVNKGPDDPKVSCSRSQKKSSPL